MLHAVIFDMGNVLLRYDPEHFLDRMGVNDPADRELLLGEISCSPLWPMLDSGELTEAGLEERVLPKLPPRLRAAAHDLIFRWDQPIEPVPGMEELLRDCRAAGLRLFLLSNASLRQPEYWPRVPGSGLFEDTVVSAFCRMVKPDRGIFMYALERFGLRGEECLFVDDMEKNVKGAESAGIEGFLFTGDAQALRRRVWERLG